MSDKILLNHGWLFHMGELRGGDAVKKIANKAGMSGGASNLTRGEGLILEQPAIFTHMTGRGDSIYDIMGVKDRLSGNWVIVDLPHDWMFRQPFNNQTKDIAPTDVLECVVDNPGYFTHGIAYYRKVFTSPGNTAGSRVRLEFEGVMHNCDIWLNGHYLGAHVSGYTGFSFDITEYMGDNNALLVRTDSRGNEGWWYEGAGIYRDVWLVVHSEVSIRSDGLWARVDRISGDTASGYIIAELENHSNVNADVEITCEIFSPENEGHCTLTGNGPIGAFSQENLSLPFTIKNPVLWDLNAPKLYTLKAIISKCGGICDTAETTFGLRQIEYTRRGLFLNGKRTEIKGVCEHQDFAGVGVALTEDILLYKVRRFKDMGANAIRSAHHPAVKALLDICDREGVLVLNENRHFSLNPEAMCALRQLVRESRNHPCVFMYCLENEEFNTLTPQGKATLRRMKSFVNHLDPTREVTMAGAIAKSDAEYVAIADVAGFNYDGNDAAAHLINMPGLRVMATEDGNLQSARGIYADDKIRNLCSSYHHGTYNAEAKDAGSFGGASSQGMFQYSWYHNNREVPELGGVFFWTGMDYRGESSPWYWPAVCSQNGAMDLCGFAKDVYYFWQSVWLETPVVHVLPHWNWPRMEGRDIDVETYCNCEEIELFINGVSQGRRNAERGRIVHWRVQYKPGELKAVGYCNGAFAAEAVRKTFNTAAEIRLEPIFAGKELVLVKASAYDSEGTFCEDADTRISFSIINGEIVGCGNGDPASHEDDTAPVRKLFNGLALVIAKPYKNAELTARYVLSSTEKSVNLTL